MKRISIEEFKQALAPALKGFPVSFAYLYGSQVRGTVHRESDIDIAVALQEREGAREGLLLEILAAINKNLPVPTEKLDVKDFAALPLAVQFRIVREGQLAYLSDVKAHG